MELLFVHGFGSDKVAEPFIEIADKFILDNDLSCSFNVFRWNSVLFEPADFVDVRNISAKFTQAMENTEGELSRFEQVLIRLEEKGTPYCIVAHSLGCFLVNSFLNMTKINSKHCNGIFFIGAADDRDRVVSNNFFRNSFEKIVNYYSPNSDWVLKISFHAKSGKVAGGSKGFNSKCFDNYRCSASHAKKGVLIHTDWTRLIPAIIELSAYRLGTPVTGELLPNIRTSITDGKKFWNNLLELNVSFEGDISSVWVQQHKVTGLYRLSVWSGDTTMRKRVAWSNRLQPILDYLENI
jgi:hypothetical protein